MRINAMLMAGAFAAVMAVPAVAQQKIKIGVTLSTTGALASLGIPMKNAVALMPKTIGGKEVEYIILDDATDTTMARKNAERFVSEDHVDAIIGPATTPNTLAITELAARSKTPMISLGAGTVIIEPMDANRRWVFKTPFNDSTSARATAQDMVKKGAKKAAVIAFSDAYGESWVNEFGKAAKAKNIEVVKVERYDRNDTSVLAQVLKIMAARPDAVLIAGSGTPGVLPQATLREKGYKGPIYQTTGVTNNDFIRVGGKSVEGALVASAPFMVADDIPQNHPAKAAAMNFKSKYEAAYGAGSATGFASYAWDAGLLMEAAMVKAMATAAPGTVEFRTAVRDALENTKNFRTSNGINNMSPTDHSGYSEDAAVLVMVKDGRWRLAAD